MKKGKMQWVLLVLMWGMVWGGVVEAAEGKRDSKVRYFSKDSVYIYGLGSSNSMTPDFGNYPALGTDRASTLAPVVGLGFRVINIAERFFINLEFDFTPAKFDFSGQMDHSVDFYSLMCNIEMKVFRRSPVSFFFGMGASLVALQDPFRGYDGSGYYFFGNDSTVAMAVEFGAKYPLTKKLFFRSSVRVYGEVTPEYDYEYEYWDEYSDNSKLDTFSTSVSVGIEYHF